MLPFGKRKPSGWTAVCLYPQRIDVARVRSGAGLPQVEMLESFERSGNLDEALTRLRRKFDLGRAACTTLAAPGQYQLLQVEAPTVSREEMREAARWKIQDMVDYPVEQATVDVLDIETPGGGGGRPHSVFVVAAAAAGTRTVTRASSRGRPGRGLGSDREGTRARLRAIPSTPMRLG